MRKLKLSERLSEVSKVNAKNITSPEPHVIFHRRPVLLPVPRFFCVMQEQEDRNGETD